MKPNRSFLPLWLAAFIDSLGFGLAYPILTLMFTSNIHPLFRHDISAPGRYFLLGIGYLLFPAALFFGSSLLRDLAERLGRKRILLVALLGLTLGFILMGMGNARPSLFLLFLGRALTGFFSGMQPIAQGIISETSEGEEKEKCLKKLSSAIGIGLISGPILGGVLADPNAASFFNDSTPFYFAALLCLVATFWGAAAVTTTKPSSPDLRPAFFKPIHLLAEGIKDRRIFHLSIIFFLTQFAFITFYQTLQVKMSIRFSYQALDLGLFNGILGLGFGFGLFFSMRALEKKVDPHRFAWIGQLAASVMILLSGSSYFPFMTAAFSILSCSAYMITFLMLTLAFTAAVSPMRSGYIMGIFAALIPFSWTLSGFTTNLLSLFSAGRVILFAGLLMLVATFLMKIYRRKYPHRAGG